MQIKHATFFSSKSRVYICKQCHLLVYLGTELLNCTKIPLNVTDEREILKTPVYNLITLKCNKLAVCFKTYKYFQKLKYYLMCICFHFIFMRLADHHVISKKTEVQKMLMPDPNNPLVKNGWVLNISKLLVFKFQH